MLGHPGRYRRDLRDDEGGRRSAIRVVVTATNAAGHATIASEQTDPIDDAPYNLERPSTSGTPKPAR